MASLTYCVVLMCGAIVTSSPSLRSTSDSSAFESISSHNLQFKNNNDTGTSAVRTKRHFYALQPSLNSEFQTYLQQNVPLDKLQRDVNGPAEFFLKAGTVAELEMHCLLGNRLHLDDLELQASKIILEKKISEYDKGLSKTEVFPPAKNFLLVKDLIEKSEIFQIIKKMPKGATLFGLLIASVPQAFMYELTFENNLYFRFGDNLEFKFSKTAPEPGWKSLSEIRSTADPNFVENMNDAIKAGLILPKPDAVDKSSPNFVGILHTYRTLIQYLPNFTKTFRAVLETLYEDNIMFSELYYDFPEVYDLEGNIYPPSEIVQFAKGLLADFIATHPDFIGIRFVYVPIDFLTPENLQRFRIASTQLWISHPDMVAGFGVMLRGETEKPYSAFIDEFLKFPKEMKLMLDAGITTNWGTGADLDVLDAYALDATSFGAGLTLTKHPIIVDILKKNHVPLKSGPLTTHMLGLAPDLRSHPAVPLIAVDFPIVISNVAGTVWNATGLSYDLYAAYVAMTPRFCDLRCLKQFVLNSLLYSSLPYDQKVRSIEAWQVKWSEFIIYVVTNYK